MENTVLSPFINLWGKVLAALLRCNLHTIKCGHGKCASQRFSVNAYSCAPLAQLGCRTFPSQNTFPRSPAGIAHPASGRWPQASVYTGLPLLNVSRKRNSSGCGFCIWHLCSWGSATSQPLSVACSLWLLNSVPACECLALCFSLTSPWAFALFPSLGCYERAPMNVFLQVFVQTSLFAPLGWIVRSGAGRSFVKFKFNLLRNGRTVLSVAGPFHVPSTGAPAAVSPQPPRAWNGQSFSF